MKKTSNFGGKIPTKNGFVKNFNNNKSYYPLRTTQSSKNDFVKSFSPNPSIGSYIKSFNNY
jgi:hypothetical protein